MRAALLSLVLLPGIAWGQAPNPSFNLVNQADQPIARVYATPAGVDRWGGDRLAQSFVPPGATFPVRLPSGSGCGYDIRVVYADGRAEERRRVNTCGVDAIVFPGGGGSVMPGGRGAQAGNQASGNQASGNQASGNQASGDPSFRLLNRGRSEVNEVYVSPSGDGEWGRDRLGDDTVSSGGTRVIRMPPGACTYDVRVVFASGEALERRRVNLCALTDLRVP